MTDVDADSVDEAHRSGVGTVDPHEAAHAAALYYLARMTPSASFADEKPGTARTHHKPVEVEERRELVRIETCAVFHKLTPGAGVPHSFVGFVRQYPALPRVVVSVLPFLLFSF